MTTSVASLPKALARDTRLARDRALFDVLGPSTPPNTGFEFLAGEASDVEIGPLRLLRFCSAPGLSPKTSLYVTSGLSDPGRGDLPRDGATDDRFSGLGIELAVSVADANNIDDWAQYFLADVALAVAEQDQPAMSGDLVALEEGIGAPPENGTPFSHAVVLDGGPHRSRLVLPTGHCVLLHLVGLFEDEVDALVGNASGGTSQFGRRLFRAGLTRPSSHVRSSIAHAL